MITHGAPEGGFDGLRMALLVADKRKVNRKSVYIKYLQKLYLDGTLNVCGLGGYLTYQPWIYNALTT